MKDPDQLHEGINDQLDIDLASMPEDEAEAIREIRMEKALDVASEWFKYSEYLTVEIDTEAGTIKIISIEEQENE